MAELWVTAGWGGKKLIEEYELQRDKLLDSALDLCKWSLLSLYGTSMLCWMLIWPLRLAYLGDDYDESEMWQ